MASYAPDRSDEKPTATQDAPPEGKDKERSKGLLGFFRELPVLLVVAFILALLIKAFLVQAFYIPSASMEPTLDVGDRVLVNKVVYKLHPPRRGDIIVFEEPHLSTSPDQNPVSAFWHWLVEGLGVSSNPQKDFIKRVIGLPGERVAVENGRVFVDGSPVNEPYLSPI